MIKQSSNLIGHENILVTTFQFCVISCNKLKKKHFCFFFFHLSHLSQTLTIYRIAGEGSEPSLFLSTISIRSRTFRDLIAVFHLTWLTIIFNPSACNEIYPRLGIGIWSSINCIKLLFEWKISSTYLLTDKW